MAKVRSITRHQARLADKNAEGLTSRVVPACRLATNLSKGGLQMALCRKLKGWEGYVVGPLSYWQSSMRLKGACPINLV